MMCSSCFFIVFFKKTYFIRCVCQATQKHLLNAIKVAVLLPTACGEASITLLLKPQCFPLSLSLITFPSFQKTSLTSWTLTLTITITLKQACTLKLVCRLVRRVPTKWPCKQIYVLTTWGTPVHTHTHTGKCADCELFIARGSGTSLRHQLRVGYKSFLRNTCKHVITYHSTYNHEYSYIAVCQTTCENNAVMWLQT